MTQEEATEKYIMIKLKWMIAALVIVLGSFAATQYQFWQDGKDEDQRIEAQDRQADYINDLAIHAINTVLYNSCLGDVQRSIGNRGWKLWLLEELEAQGIRETPEGAAFLDEGRKQLEKYLPPVTGDTCVDPGDPPTPPTEQTPAQLQEAANTVATVAVAVQSILQED